MRRGLLQDYANQVCQMFNGWRLTIADLPLLVAAGHGAVDIDLLSGEYKINDRPVERLGILTELEAWLSDAIARDELPSDLIRALRLHTEFQVDETREGTIETRRLQLDCTSELATAERTIQGHHAKREIWTREGTDTVWMILDER